ncbi:MAG: hypothetical protein ACYTG2_10395 [Planctomycetota bacterium]
MSGHVFHPGHDEWHGQTVVVYTTGPRTLIGRWDAVEGGTLRMLDVAMHEEDAAGAEPRDAWVAKLKQYGIPVEHKALALPRDAVTKVVRLRDA